jgi:hypothetical protein
MRHVMPALLLALVTSGLSRGAIAAPFEPGTIPDDVEAVGHLDADALRKTQIFAAVGGQTAIDDALDNAPPEVRPLARTLARSIRGVSFWKDGERGAVYLETRDGPGLNQAVAKLPVKRARTIDGIPTYTMSEDLHGTAMHGHNMHGHHGHLAVYGDTLVLAESVDSLERSIHVLGGKGPSLAGSSKLPLSARQGVFVFVTIGDDMLNQIQKTAHAKLLQLALRSLAVDVGETAGIVTANARAEMRSADAVQKAKSILDGLRALASLSDEPQARMLLDAVTVTTSGLALEVTARLPAAELAKAIQQTK